MIATFLATIPVRSVGSWRGSWAWGVPLIVLTVMIHVMGLGFIKGRAFSLSNHAGRGRHHTTTSLIVIGGVTLSATLLHAIEASIWAVAYMLLGALADSRSAILYSLNALTSYGHANLELTQHWELMGSLEALNGWLLFGLTTAFLFAVIDKVWMPEGK